MADNPNVAGTTVKQASLKSLQLPPTCPVDNLDYELNNLSEAWSSCSADHLEGNFDFIPSAGMGTVCPCSSWFQFLLLLPLGTAVRKEKGKNFKLFSNTASLCSEKPSHHREGMGTDPIIHKYAPMYSNLYSGSCYQPAETKKNLKKDFRRGKVIDSIRQNNRQISNKNIGEKEAENLLEETGE